MVDDIKEAMDALVHDYGVLIAAADHIENEEVRKRLIALFESEKARLEKMEAHMEDGEAE